MDNFIDHLRNEHARSVAKYPPELWATLDPIDMLAALLDEVDELKSAMWANNLHGEHGIAAEGVQVANVAMRIVTEMQRRG